MATMLEDKTKAAGDTQESSVFNRRNMSESSGSREQQVIPSSLKRRLGKKYGRRSMELVNRHLRSMLDLAAYANNAAFLERCRGLRIVPKAYRVACREIKNTRHIVRILDECSHRLMLADLDYNRLRKVQVTSLVERLYDKLEKMMSAQDLNSVMVLTIGKYKNIFESTEERQRNMFAELVTEYKIDRQEDQDNGE